MTQKNITPHPDTQAKGLSEKIWSIFSSVKLTVMVLLLLAITSIIGTLIPQNQQPAYYFHTYGEFLFRFFTAINIFDMYHSWWFQFLVLMLAMNLTVCSVDRLPRVWKIVKKKPSFDVDRFRKSKNAQTFEVKGTVKDKEPGIERFIRKKFGPVTAGDLPEGRVLYSEKGRVTRLGVYVVHASVLLLLAGGMVGSFWGFEGSMMIPEGDQSDEVYLKNSDKVVHLPFSIRCNDFDLSHYDNGAPKEYRSDLTIIDNGQDLFSRSIIVNDPLRYKGINIFQSSYGALPGDSATLNFTSKDSGMIYPRKVVMGEPQVLPENLGTFTLTNLMNNYPFMGRDLGECFIGVIETPDGKKEDVVLPLQFKMFDKMRRGNVAVSIEDYDKKYYTGLQVTRDPGVWLVYGGFILMILGCYVAFFMSHQTLCVAVEQKGKNTCRVLVSGTANKNRMGMALQIKRIASDLKDA